MSKEELLTFTLTYYLTRIALWGTLDANKSFLTSPVIGRFIKRRYSIRGSNVHGLVSNVPVVAVNQSETEHVSSTRARQRVLVVGSESALLNHVRDVLVRETLPITSLTKEQALIRIQKGLVPDVVLLQVVAAQTLETLGTLRKTLPTIPIIVFSSRHDMQFVVTAMKMGASDYIQLPFNIDGLKIGKAFSFAGRRCARGACTRDSTVGVPRSSVPVRK